MSTACDEADRLAALAFVFVNYLYEYHLVTICGDRPGAPTLLPGVAESDAQAIEAAHTALEVHMLDGDSDEWTLAHTLAAARMSLTDVYPTGAALRRHVGQCLELIDEALSLFPAYEAAVAVEGAPAWLREHRGSDG